MVLTWWRCAVWLIAISCTLNASYGTVSYTADGSWIRVPLDKPDCEMFTCLPVGRFSWRANRKPYRIYNNETGCAMLQNNGIRQIEFYGDSYMRHIYAAMLITLNGNYASGSLIDPRKSKCRFKTQFSEKQCNVEKLNRRGIVCGGHVKLNAKLTSASHAGCDGNSGTVVLFSAGNHAIGSEEQRAQRNGVNNASIYQQHFQQALCPRLHQTDHLCSLWWISTHRRVAAMFPDEEVEVVHQYNLQMRDFFDAGQCGKVNYIDVYNMTASLAQRHETHYAGMTYDNVHWGFEINLVKVQIVLNALAAGGKI